MKNRIKNFLSLAVAIGALFALAVPAIAQTPVSVSFLNGYNLRLYPSSTNSSTGSNLFNGGTNEYASGWTITNALVGQTLTGGTVVSNWVSYFSPIMKTNVSAFATVPLWSNQGGRWPIRPFTLMLLD